MTEEELRAACKVCRKVYPYVGCRGCPNYADVELVRHKQRQSQADRYKGLTWDEAKELQAYRKTGLTVERAAELGKADREGRVVIKPYCPVKVGDKVYAIRDNAVVGYRVTEKSEGNGWMMISACRHDGRLSFGLLDIGKTVFLTREEAEKALEAENHERPDDQRP